jgi:signal transduction histidine kinase
MSFDKNRSRAMLSWLFVGTLLVLCTALGLLQYRWIGEVTEAARDRLKGTLQANLERLSADFNGRITTGVRNLLPDDSVTPGHMASDTGARYRGWAASDRRASMIEQLAVAEVQDDATKLYGINLETGAPSPMDWPASWQTLQEWMESRLRPGGRGGRGFMGPPGERAQGLLFEIPVMNRPEGGGPGQGPGPGPMGFGRRESGWVIVQLHLPYLRDTLLPEVLQSHLGSGGTLDYSVEVVSRSEPPSVIYQSDPGARERVAQSPDASISLLSALSEPFGGRRGGGDRTLRGARGRQWEAEFEGRGRGPGEPGRWLLYVRHKAGSLEAAVFRTQQRNLMVTAGVLLLMLATVGALVRYTRRAQRLAELQMDFVAGVSHELRTPLTVIHTAAYNLRGKLAANPAQVERYGALIHQESGRLAELVEQVLSFTAAKAGNIVQKREPIAVEAVIDDAVESSRSLLQQSRCRLESKIQPGLPLVLGDAVTLRHAIQNLLGNAIKYGSEESSWIGISASTAGDSEKPVIEIRVSDHGPGIPEEEQEHIFEPFFRGQRALADQIHGTGLGLSLVKQIVEAHSGDVAVRSSSSDGTEFTIRLPAAPPEYQDEFAHTSG